MTWLASMERLALSVGFFRSVRSCHAFVFAIYLGCWYGKTTELSWDLE